MLNVYIYVRVSTLDNFRQSEERIAELSFFLQIIRESGLGTCFYLRVEPGSHMFIPNWSDPVRVTGTSELLSVFGSCHDVVGEGLI